MKNFKSKRAICIILIIALLLAIDIFADQRVYAKTKKLKMSSSSVSLTVSKSLTVKVKGSYKIKVKPSKKKYVKVTVKGKKIKIKGLKKGSVKLTVKGYKNGKLKAKGTIKVTIYDKMTENVTPSAETEKYDAGQYSIKKVHSGEATFYDPGAGGAANLDDYAKAHNLYTAAMNNEDYMNGLAGAYIEVTDKDGDQIKVLITDRLPEGKKGDIDLTRKAFKVIEPEATGRMKITWKIIPLPTDDPIQFMWKPSSTQYWGEIQVRNGRYPIKKLEYLDKGTNKYVELPRKEYNYFTAKEGFGAKGPYTFRVTDFYGHVLVEKNININTKEEAVNGSANFPY